MHAGSANYGQHTTGMQQHIMQQASWLMPATNILHGSRRKPGAVSLPAALFQLLRSTCVCVLADAWTQYVYDDDNALWPNPRCCNATGSWIATMLTCLLHRHVLACCTSKQTAEQHNAKPSRIVWWLLQQPFESLKAHTLQEINQ